MPTNSKEYQREYYQRTKEHQTQYKKKWFQDNKRTVYNRKVSKKYGVTMEQLKQMFIAQEGKCAICGDAFTSRKDCFIDHNHRTGAVRQLLCPPCNAAIGFFKEDISIMSKAIAYVNKWNM